MVNSRQKGYRVERKIRLLMEKHKWLVIRAGRSLGEADLICLKSKKCILLQIKSTKKKKFYYYGHMKKDISGFPFYLIVDFGYGNMRILPPTSIVASNEGEQLKEFLAKTH